MSKKELLYIEDTLEHIQNMEGYLSKNIENIEDEDFRKVLESLYIENKEVFKRFYKLINE